ncbi:calcium:sodium antiporter [Aureococcus anophagefferens]|nr:calcium:sodium antiporter [Aureococcus anophagefferens]
MSSPRHSRQRRPPWGDGQTVLLRSAGLGLALSVFAVAAVMVPSVWGDAAAWARSNDGDACERVEDRADRCGFVRGACGGLARGVDYLARGDGDEAPCQVDARPFARDVSVLGLSIFAISCCALDRSIDVTESAALLGLYACYVLAIVYAQRGDKDAGSDDERDRVAAAPLLAAGDAPAGLRLRGVHWGDAPSAWDRVVHVAEWPFSAARHASIPPATFDDWSEGRRRLAACAVAGAVVVVVLDFGLGGDARSLVAAGPDGPPPLVFAAGAGGGLAALAYACTGGAAPHRHAQTALVRARVAQQKADAARATLNRNVAHRASLGMLGADIFNEQKTVDAELEAQNAKKPKKAKQAGGPTLRERLGRAPNTRLRHDGDQDRGDGPARRDRRGGARFAKKERQKARRVKKRGGTYVKNIELHYAEFFVALFNFLTLTNERIVRFTFDLIDEDKSGYLQGRGLRDGDGDVEFEEFYRVHCKLSSLMFPAFRLRRILRIKCMGNRFWRR